MSAPRIFVACPDTPTACGGVKKLYRMVEILVRHGFDAALLHARTSFQCRWFHSDIPVRSAATVSIGPEDWLVLPETFERAYVTSHRWSWKRQKRVHRRLTRLAARTVIFNQNCYLTFRKHSWKDLRRPTLYQRSHTVAAIVVSEDSYRYLRTAFPNLRLFRIRNAVDPDRFFPTGAKKSQIAFMPRKNAQDVVQVLKILHLRGSLDGFRLAPIDGMSEKQVARTLQESAIFLSFGYPEGFGLPPTEAMACGCFVIGYDGLGGREFFRPEFSCSIETGHIAAYVEAVEAVLAEWRRRPEAVLEKGRLAADFIHTTYSPEAERRDVLRVWNCLLSDQAGTSRRTPDSQGPASPNRRAA
ncbi:MAG TPA: glycosyltransferase family 1 protein [Planctomycetaceae bacterium]|nr:glycosyltransferase family 1 protein [Planctomycetaceae bacterium]